MTSKDGLKRMSIAANEAVVEARARNDRLSTAREGIVKALEGVLNTVSPDLYRKAAAEHGRATQCDEIYAAARAALRELHEAAKEMGE